MFSASLLRKTIKDRYSTALLSLDKATELTAGRFCCTVKDLAF